MSYGQEENPKAVREDSAEGVHRPWDLEVSDIFAIKTI